MKTFVLSILTTAMLAASATAITTTASGTAAEQKEPVVTETTAEVKAETPAQIEETETIYFDAVELDIEEVEVDAEGDIDSL